MSATLHRQFGVTVAGCLILRSPSRNARGGEGWGTKSYRADRFAVGSVPHPIRAPAFRGHSNRMGHPSLRLSRARTHHWQLGVMMVAGVLAVGAVRPAMGVSVKAMVSSREVVPGEALELQVVIEGASQAGQPQLPSMPDFIVKMLRRAPNQRSSVQIIQGRVTRHSTLTYAYQLRARRTGRLTIPAITVKAEGKTYKTRPIPIVVAKGETSDALLVEFIASRKSVYVEQPFELTLRIWVRVFRQGKIKLSDRQMSRLFDRDCDFGRFAKQIAKKGFTAQETPRKDSEGQERKYYLYEVSQTIRPDKPGPYKPEPVTIGMTYPVALGRDPFGDLTLRRRRHLIQQAKAPDIVVQPIPEEGRPSTYNGAIGRYTWKVWPDRTDVRRGELITLNMEISGLGLLDRVPAPRLAKVPELTERFKVLDEQLAGEVKGGKKVYRQKIRAINDETDAIPPIPFSFFDPDADGGKGRFVTVKSDPIPITVYAAEALSPNQIVVPAAMGPGRSSLLTAAADSIRANYGEAEAVLANQAFAPGPGWAASLALPPGLWLVGWLIRRRSDRLRNDVALARRRGARKQVEARLQTAAGSPDAAVHLADALLNYIADRANLPAGGLTRPDAVGRLREDAVPDEDIEELDKLLQACEEARYAGMDTGGSDLVTQAKRCLQQLERTWKP